MTQTYIFVLGTAWQLAQAELESVLNRQKINFSLVFVQEPVVGYAIDQELDVGSLQQTLGGTIKIAQSLGKLEQIRPESVFKLMKPSVTSQYVFGFSTYGGTLPLPKLSSDVKQLLLDSTTHVRFVVPKEQVISSVVIQKQNVQEFILVKQENIWWMGKTVAAQNVDAWSGRDFTRPHADAKAGMLPLKVARMLVNLAMIEDSASHIYDPFCGMGSILAEGLLLNCIVTGSDISESAAEKARKNIEWLRDSYQLKNAQFHFFSGEVTHAASEITPASIDAIVTEPFMGEPFETRGTQLLQRQKPVNAVQVKNTLKGLEKLYIGAFRAWQPILKQTGKIVIILPEIYFQNHAYTVKKLIDNCEKLGYTLSQGPYKYARPHAIVTRNVYIFRKNSL